MSEIVAALFAKASYGGSVYSLLVLRCAAASQNSTTHLPCFRATAALQQNAVEVGTVGHSKSCHGKSASCGKNAD